MEKSKHNIISKIAGFDKYFVVNLLSQNADIISGKEAEILMSDKEINNNEFIEKGYVVDSLAEEELYREKYLNFIDLRESDELQLFFVINYSCNFDCSYCYQKEYTNEKSALDFKVIDAFFTFIESAFAGRSKYITIFGGEPLINSHKQRKIISYFIEKANRANLEIAVVTNGYHLVDYMPVLKKARIRELQVTLDGVGEAHDRRRALAGGGKTFDKIVQGIDKALQEKIPVNLRVVVDKENVNELPKLAKFAIEKKWTNSPLFKTQLGRNYELHSCQKSGDKLYSRISMYKDVYMLLKNYPEIAEFHKPTFSVSKFLFENGELPAPLFDSCPGAKTEWAFDYSGKIYACTATVGKSGEELGMFYPEIRMDEQKILEWEDRDILAIEKCKDCELQLACGGGCAAVAKNKNGSIVSNDCRPVKELLELGISYYFNK